MAKRATGCRGKWGDSRPIGVSHNGLSIGNIGGETDFLEFLTSQVYTQENIIFRNKRIEKILA